MLHAKFQDHRTSSSGEENFSKFLPYGYILLNIHECLPRLFRGEY